MLLPVLLAATAGITDSVAQDVSPARVMRLVSGLPAHQGAHCFALVLDETDGLPGRVLNLGALEASLCQPASEPDVPVARLRLALAVAETASTDASPLPAATETLAPEDLPARVLAPVPITLEQLRSRERLVVAAGLNYRLHRDEVDLDAEALLLLPKPVVPTGAYAPVPRGVRIGVTPAQPVVLMDYEVELGFVLLDDVDLGAPMRSREELLRQVAFFTANDVSDREPIVNDSEYGYTRGKSHPGYLPIGPWMVRGDRLDPLSATAGSRELMLSVSVRETDGAVTVRQADSSEAMIQGPWEILRTLGARYRNGEQLCMLDADGEPRFMHDVRGVLPAGSIVLTGTPGGTAVKAPGLLTRARLFVMGGFSIAGARRRFIEESHADVERLGYLEPGERVDTRVIPLGRQRWEVVDSEVVGQDRDSVYGRLLLGPCPGAS